MNNEGITRTGDNINVLICSKNSQHNNWMTFLCWFSIHRNIPSSRVAISCFRNNCSNTMPWTTRCNVKCFMHKNEGFGQSIGVAVKNQVIDTPLLVIPSTKIMVKELTHDFMNKIQNVNVGKNKSESIWFFRNKKSKEKIEDISEIESSFDDYNCIKNFDLNKWCEEKQSNPFGLYWKYMHEQMTQNEATILYLWQKAKPFYESLNWQAL